MPGAGPVATVRGREVVLWPDADTAGARHMERIAAALLDADAEARPRGVLDLAG
jgi:DNA primase